MPDSKPILELLGIKEAFEPKQPVEGNERSRIMTQEFWMTKPEPIKKDTQPRPGL